MAKRLTVDEALEATLDDDFGLSDGESSDEEGEDTYGYLGEPVLHRTDIEELGEAVVDGPLSDHDGNDDDLSDSGDGSELALNVQKAMLMGLRAANLQQKNLWLLTTLIFPRIAIVLTQVSLTPVVRDSTVCTTIDKKHEL